MMHLLLREKIPRRGIDSHGKCANRMTKKINGKAFGSRHTYLNDQIIIELLVMRKDVEMCKNIDHSIIKVECSLQ